jgi:hypothetical protein
VKSADGRAECLHCGGEFWPRRRGHVFCSSRCRHRGERRERRGPIEREQVARLFDPFRDPEERVRDDDWHPTPDSVFHDLDWCQTVETRRRWYLNLIRDPPCDRGR